MSRIRPVQHATAGPGNVIWLKALHWRRSIHGAARRPDANDERLRAVLTAMAGLDALELALLDVCPPGTPDEHRQLMATRMAAAQSRRALHEAHPALSSVEMMELLHVMNAVRRVAASPSTRPPMTFETLPSRGSVGLRWGTAALALLLMSIQCMVAVHGGLRDRNPRPSMTSLPANVPPADADAEQRTDGPRHTEMPALMRGSR